MRDALQRVDDGAREVVGGVGLVLGAGPMVRGSVHAIHDGVPHCSCDSVQFLVEDTHHASNFQCTSNDESQCKGGKHMILADHLRTCTRFEVIQLYLIRGVTNIMDIFWHGIRPLHSGL